MGSVDPSRLVLIRCKADGVNRAVRFGTGYFVTEDLVLTASHVVDGRHDAIEIRPETNPGWSPGSVIWCDDKLDAALIRAASPLHQAAEVKWAQAIPQADADWTSTAYPVAAAVLEGGVLDVKTVGLRGVLYAQGGAGQGPRELDLEVKAAPPAEGWHGISGAPVFVDDELVGIIKTVPTGFDGQRLAALPADALLGSTSFRLALANAWFEDVPDTAWALALVAEGRDVGEFAETVRGNIQRRADNLALQLGHAVRPEPVVKSVMEAVETPEHWLQLVRAICKAPVLVVDVTGFQPATMLLLGIRAVVRRGITITTTAHPVDESQLSELPFTIQESKLVSHGGGKYEISDRRHRLNVLGSAMEDAFEQLRRHPGYLDLPAYDAVRQPLPETVPGKSSVQDAILMLCSYHAEYRPHWLFVSDIVATRYANRDVRRMLDLTSPRLVGQALYEQIRWTTTCVVDWTQWRPNVFFELGVRLACSEVPPVSLVEQSDVAAAAQAGELTQKAKLIQLFNPTVYTLDGSEAPVRESLALHDLIVKGQPPPQSMETIPYAGTYRAALDAFDWRQERITIRPHELLRDSAELQLGKDPQKRGAFQVLYFANPEYGPELQRSVEERWIAAWYYLRYRYAPSEIQSNADLRTQLKLLGEAVLQSVPSKPGDAQIDALRNDIVDLIDQLAEG